MRSNLYLPRDRGRCRTIVLKVRQMRLTHYEDGLLCGERFCINLIRHCGDTFPGLGEGHGLDRLLAYTHIVRLNRSPLFLWRSRRKEKANKKKAP